MVENRFQRHSADFHSEPKIGRIFLFSLILHVVAVLIFSGTFSHHSAPPKRPVYYVDLTKLPVANPRAGRPDGQVDPGRGGQKRAPAPAPKTTPKAAKTVKRTAPPAKTKAAAQPKTATKPKSTAKAVTATKRSTTADKPKAVANAAATTTQTAAGPDSGYQAAMGAVEKMRRKQEMAALREKLAALATTDSRTGSSAETGAGTGSGTGSGAPLGMPDGRGDQAGVSQELWLQERLKKNWSLSKYQVMRRDLEAQVRITYNAEGYLTGKKFLKPSGDNTFDDSITRAILKSRQLEFKPGRQLEVVVLFNLKDLMD